MKNKLPLFLILISVVAIVLFLVFYKTNSSFNWYLVRENVTLKVDEEKNIEINLDDNSKLKLNYKILKLTISQNNDYGQEVKHFHIHVIPRYKNDKFPLASDCSKVEDVYHKLVD